MSSAEAASMAQQQQQHSSCIVTVEPTYASIDEADNYRRLEQIVTDMQKLKVDKSELLEQNVVRCLVFISIFSYNTPTLSDLQDGH
jgi:hypothetical protein